MINLLFLESAKKFGGQERGMLDLIKRLDRKRFKSLLGVQLDSYLYQHQQQLNIRVAPVKMRNALDMKGFISIVQLIFRHRIHLLITYSDKDCWLGLFIARICGKKIIRLKNLELFKHKIAYNLVDRVIVPSLHIKHFLIARGVKAKNIALIYPSIDTQLFRFCQQARQRIRQAYALTDQDIVLVYVATFRRLKGQIRLVEALIYLHDPHLKLMLVGDVGEADYLAEVEQWVIDMGLEEQVIFTGAQQTIASFLSAGDIFVFPSLSEAFNSSILEALACGLPVVANDIPSVKEIADSISNAQYFFSYAYDDVNALVTQLQRCLQKLPTDRTEIRQSLVHMRNQFDLNYMTDRFEWVFSEVVHE